MNCVYRLVTTLLVLALMSSCNEKGKISVDKVEPAEGITAGGDHVTIIGSGFEPGKTQVRVSFGRHVCDQVVIQSTGKISVVTPNGDKGPVDVTLDFDNGSRFKIPTGFRYVEPKQTGDVRQAFFGKQAKENK
jgi:hypothetical protein